MTISLSKQEAKRIAIRAQGLDSGRNDQPVTKEHISACIRSMGVLQIDSVNVCVRSHYMPMFSRLGSYDQGLLEELTYEDNDLFETWAHEACFVPVEQRPLFRQRMDSKVPRHRIAKLIEEQPGYLDHVMKQVTERGSMTASELDGAGQRQGPWWGYNSGKIAMEWFFAIGKMSVATRKNFTRYYDLTERVIPKPFLNGYQPDAEESHREMLKIAVRAHGVGTTKDLGDYYRIKTVESQRAIDQLLTAGDVLQVEVEGWEQPAYVPSELISAEPTNSRALLTPFDPLVWNRDRIDRIFDFFYRIEIYVPEPKRQYGYYVYPFLLGEDLVARVDLKADRQKGVLRVKGAFVEEGHDSDYVASNLAEELRLMADWLGLKRVVVGRKGDLITSLRAALKR